VRCYRWPWPLVVSDLYSGHASQGVATRDNQVRDDRWRLEAVAREPLGMRSRQVVRAATLGVGLINFPAEQPAVAATWPVLSVEVAYEGSHARAKAELEPLVTAQLVLPVR